MYFYYSNCKNTTFFLNRFFFCLFYVFLEFNKCVGSVLGSYSLCSFYCIVAIYCIVAMVEGDERRCRRGGQFLMSRASRTPLPRSMNASTRSMMAAPGRRGR